MKHPFFLLIFIIFTGYILAQESAKRKDFSDYSTYLSKGYGITCKKLPKFTNLMFEETFRITEKGKSGMFYCPISQSADTECMLLYSSFPMYMSTSEMGIGKEAKAARSQMIGEIKTALGLVDNYGFILEKASIEVDKYLTLVFGEEARQRFNVDTVFIYKIPLEKPYKDKYTYCTAMTLYKKNAPLMFFKWFFTESGKKQEDQYMDLLNKRVWYGKEGYFYNKEAIRKYTRSN